MGRVLADATEAERIFASANQQLSVSRTACEARKSFTKSAFDELRSACVEHGGNMTAKFLDLEGEIDKFASKCTLVEKPDKQLVGTHAGLADELAEIQAKAEDLRGEAVAEKARATHLIAATEDLVTDPLKP